MLVLTMRATFDHEGEDSRVRLKIGDTVVWVTLIRTQGEGTARLGFEAPDEVVITRQGLLGPDEQYRRRPVYRR